MIFLSTDDLVKVARRVAGPDVVVTDPGLLESASARPQATFEGLEVYPTTLEKAAAFVHSLVGNQALLDGNKRLGLAALITFLGVNGLRLTATNDEAYEFIMAIATGDLRDVPAITACLTPLVDDAGPGC